MITVSGTVASWIPKMRTGFVIPAYVQTRPVQWSSTASDKGFTAYGRSVGVWIIREQHVAESSWSHARSIMLTLEAYSTILERGAYVEGLGIVEQHFRDGGDWDCESACHLSGA